MRIDLLIDLILLRRSLLIPFVVTMTESCPEALTHMSCHILAVSALADEIQGTIIVVTQKIRNLLNKDLSLSTNSTREILGAEFSRYFTWLRSHQEGLRKICRNNEIFCSVDKSVKAWLRGEEYESSSQLLGCFNQKYRKYLTNMNIPLQAFRIEDVRQAVKDVMRDSIVLNNIRYSPFDGVCRRSICNEDNRNRNRQNSGSIDTVDSISPVVTPPGECLVIEVVEEMCRALSGTWEHNMRFSVISNDDHSFSVKNCVSRSIIEKGLQDVPARIQTSLFDDTVSESSRADLPSISSSFEKVEYASGKSSEQTSFNGVNGFVRDLGSDRTDGVDSPISDSSPLGNYYASATSSKNSAKSNDFESQSYKSAVRLHESLLEMLLNQVLLAASRTTAGGDAFLILENLYGGDGLLFTPRSYTTRMQSGVKSPQHRADEEGVFSNFLGTYNPSEIKNKKALEILSRKKHENCSGIEISILLSGIRVVLKEQYNLFVKDSVEQSMELSLPLISFECTTTTDIIFPSNNDANRTYELYNKLLYNTERVCQRRISIEPMIL